MSVNQSQARSQDKQDAGAMWDAGYGPATGSAAATRMWCPTCGSSLGWDLPMHQLRKQSQNQSNREPTKKPKPTTPEKAKQTTPTQTKMTHKKPIKPPSPTNKQNNTQPPPNKTTSVLGGSTQGTTEEGRD